MLVCMLGILMCMLGMLVCMFAHAHIVSFTCNHLFASVVSLMQSAYLVFAKLAACMLSRVHTSNR